jgi:SAM-dependent methyltransferase
MANKFYCWQKLLSTPLEILRKIQKAIIKWMKFLTGSRFGLWKSGNNFFKIKFRKLDREEPNFEKISFYILFIPFFLIIAIYVYLKKKIIPNPKFNFYFFDGVSKLCKEVKENAAKWRALDLTYNNRAGKNGDLIYNFFWHSLKNSRALRNRLKLIKFLLLNSIEEISKEENEVRLISIASGSAQGVIETIAKAKERGILVKGVLIDLDPTALEYSKKLAQEMKVENQLTFLNKTASAITGIGKNFKPNLIEMVGFLEYRPFDKAVKLVTSIYQVLEKEGIFLVSQIVPNAENFFLREVINWPMVYRKPKELAKILSLSGFSLNNCIFYEEPLKVHYIAECKKI